MEVTSLLVAWSLLGQATSDPFARPQTLTASPAATQAVPVNTLRTVAAPLNAPPSAPTIAPPNALPSAASSASPLAAAVAAPSPPSSIQLVQAEAGRYDRYAPTAPSGVVPAAGSSPAGNGYPPAGGGGMSSGGSLGTSAPRTASPPGGAFPGSPMPNASMPSGGAPPAAFSNGGNAQPRALPDRVAAPMSVDPSMPARTATTTTAPQQFPAQPTTQTPPPAEDTSGAAELVREALVLPKSLELPGKATSLLEALANTSDRRRQMAAVYAYWRLAEEAGEYHYAWQQVQYLKLLSEVIAGVEQGADAGAARSAVGSRFAEANAELREAELRLTSAQTELMETAGIAADGPRPLAADLPHVGVYNTSLEKVYARRVPPARAYLLQKTLPLRREVVTTRAQTVWAAQDAYEAAFDAYRKRQLPLDDVLLAVDSLRTRRAQFLTAVRRYNDEIAEYALTSAPEGTSRETLVGMLIKSQYTPKLGKAVYPGDQELFEGGVQPVGFFEEEGAVPGEFLRSTGAPQPEPIPDAGISAAAPLGYQVPRNIAAANFDETSVGAPVPAITVPQNPLPQNSLHTAMGASGVQQASYDAVPNPFPTAAPAYAVPNLLDAPHAQPMQMAGAAPTNLQRGTPTLAPPRERVDAPLKFKVNREPLEEPGLLSVDENARPISSVAGTSPYSSGNGYSSGTVASENPKASRPTKPHHKAIAIPATATSEQVETAAPKLPSLNIPAAVPAVAPKADDQTRRRDEAVEPAGFYDTLDGVPAPRRTQELVEQLHRSAALAPDEAAVRVTLDQCLAGASGTSRRALIGAYWSTAEAAAVRTIWTQKVTQLSALAQGAMRFRESPAGAVAMLEVHGARLAAQSAEREATAELWAARWKLTDEMRKPLGETWLMTETLPHAGRYDTKLESLSAESPMRKRLQPQADRIAVLHEILQSRAEAVLLGDHASEQALQIYSAGRSAVAAPLDAFRRQTVSSEALLAAATRYNDEIADYAMRLLPGETPSETLVGALVVNRSPAAR
ncbi:MAG: hypothetical protein C0483_16670 [Pirellula sp.]|nr:hypothetical protein [Pirellula sp.]